MSEDVPVGQSHVSFFSNAILFDGVVPKYLSFTTFLSNLLAAEKYILRYIMYRAHALKSEIFRTLSESNIHFVLVSVSAKMSRLLTLTAAPAVCI
jgi:hypothetical protein